MSTIYGDTSASELGYEPLRRVDFGWIKESWRLFGANAGIWIVAVVIMIFAPSLLSMILTPFIMFTGFAGALTNPNAPPNPNAIMGMMYVIYGIVYPLMLVFYAYLYGGLYRMAVKQVAGEQITFGDIFSGGRLLWRMMGFLLLLFLVVGILSNLLMLPAVPGLVSWFTALNNSNLSHFFWPSAATLVWLFGGLLVGSIVDAVLLGLLLPSFALIADGRGVWQSIGQSVRAMRPQWGAAAGFIAAFWLLLFLGNLIFFGSFVLLPMYCLISALAYRDMIGLPRRAMSAMLFYPPPTLSQEGVWPPPPNYGPPPNPPPV